MRMQLQLRWRRWRKPRNYAITRRTKKVRLSPVLYDPRKFEAEAVLDLQLNAEERNEDAIAAAEEQVVEAEKLGKYMSDQKSKGGGRIAELSGTKRDNGTTYICMSELGVGMVLGKQNLLARRGRMDIPILA